MVDLDSLQQEAVADGRVCVVGALILNEAGRVFVQRRAWDRRLLPGCWDLVGGHVEEGERLLDALAREVEEETGWELSSSRLAYVGDWGFAPDGLLRREFDFLVKVEGDRNKPRLEVGKHIEFRWVAADELALFDENRGQDEGLVRHLVEIALRSANPGRYAFPHLAVFVDPAIAEPIERLRRRWDTAMAWQLPAHVTVIYPQEVSGLDELIERARTAARAVHPFRLRPGALRCFGRPEEGLFVEVNDVDGGWSAMRDAIVGNVERFALSHM